MYVIGSRRCRAIESGKCRAIESWRCRSLKVGGVGPLEGLVV